MIKKYYGTIAGIAGLSRGLISFFIGILLNYIFLYIIKLKKSGQMIMIITLFGVLIIGIISEMIPFMDYYAVQDLNAYANYMIFPELLIIFRYVTYFNKVCNNRLCKYLGKISWSIYVWNYPILITLYILDKIYGISFINVLSIKYLIFLVVCHITVGILSHELLEKKLTNVLKRYLTV